MIDPKAKNCSSANLCSSEVLRKSINCYVAAGGKYLVVFLTDTSKHQKG